MNLQEIQIYVMANNSTPNKILLTWLNKLSKFGLKWEFGEYGEDNLQICRNKTIKRFITQTQKQYVCMFDHDSIPLTEPWDLGQGQSINLFSHSGELLYLGFTGRGSKGHYGEDFGAMACRCSRELLLRIEPPHFKNLYDKHMTKKIYCECQHFRDKCKKLGIQSHMCGVIGHQVGGEGGMILIPDHHPIKYKTIWPKTLEEK